MLTKCMVRPPTFDHVRTLTAWFVIVLLFPVSSVGAANEEYLDNSHDARRAISDTRGFGEAAFK
jgi:hypothetical protein